MDVAPLQLAGAIQVHRIYGAIRPVAPIAPLAAGSVRTPADPALAPGLSQSDNLQLYSRAADRIEAATSVRLGQIFDRRA